MTDLSMTEDFFGGDSSRFSGPFTLLTVLSGFCGSGPLLTLGGSWLPPPSMRSGWTHHGGRRGPSGGGEGATAARSEGK